MKNRYILPLFIGTSGILFYGNSIFTSLLPDTIIVIFIRLFIFLISSFILHRGYKILEKEKSTKAVWTLALALVFLVTISMLLSYFFGFSWGFSVGIALTVLLMFILRN